MIEQRLVNLTGTSVGAVRIDRFNGAEHVVVPIVALIGDQVVWPANADTPEFVPADELARAAPSWTGRPAVGSHPQIDGVYVSANRREVLETKVFGRVMESSFSDDKRLLMEVWLDRAAAQRVGAEAVDVITRALAREPIEVSVGALVDLEIVEGVAPNGKPYKGRWRNIGSDHIAFLPRGTRGACSNEMGCGLRAAKFHDVTAEGLVIAEDTEQLPAQGHAPNLSSRHDESLRVASKEGDVDPKSLMDKLRALLGVEAPAAKPDVDLSADVNLAELVDVTTELIDLVGKRNSAADQKMIQQVHDHAAALGAECKGAVAMKTAAASSVGDDSDAQSVKERTTMKTLSERVAAFVADPRNPFTSCDQKALEALPEERLTALEQHYAAPAAVTPPDGMSFVSNDELAALRTLQAEKVAADAARKTLLVNSLKDAVKAGYSEDDLKAMSISDLERLAKVATSKRETNLVGRVVPPVGDSEPKEIPPPPSMESIARQLAGKTA